MGLAKLCTTCHLNKQTSCWKLEKMPLQCIEVEFESQIFYMPNSAIFTLYTLKISVLCTLLLFVKYFTNILTANFSVVQHEWKYNVTGKT